VYCLAAFGNKLYSGSNDKTIKIWNTETYEEIATLKDTHPVICLTLHENKLYSGGVGKTIRIWNTETYAEIANLRGHNGFVMCLTIRENRLYSGGAGADNTIRIWKI
jgi:WD40 repeat protein